MTFWNWLEPVTGVQLDCVALFSAPLGRGLKTDRGSDQYSTWDPSSRNGLNERMDRRKKIEDR